MLKRPAVNGFELHEANAWLEWNRAGLGGSCVPVSDFSRSAQFRRTAVWTRTYVHTLRMLVEALRMSSLSARDMRRLASNRGGSLGGVLWIR